MRGPGSCLRRAFACKQCMLKSDVPNNGWTRGDFNRLKSDYSQARLEAVRFVSSRLMKS